MGGLLDMLPLVIFLYVIFYVLMIRPQRKQQQQHDLLLKNLKQYDTVRTSGGIFGQVAAIDEEQDQVVLKVDEKQNVRMRVLRSSIVAVVGRGEQSSAEVATTAATGKPR